VILDTNALSAVAADEPAVVRVYRLAASMEPPVIVLGEYRFAIGQSKRQQLKKAGRPLPSNDLWIAALCRRHRLQPLITLD
jgi:predicted nucleic acid-binding protein